MVDLAHAENQILHVSNYEDFIATPFQGKVNAISWDRELQGDFSEIIKQVELKENMAELDSEELRALQLLSLIHI